MIKVNFKRCFLTSALLFSLFLTVTGQTQSLSTNYLHPERNPYLVPPSPEVASFLRYGDYPVSYSTGIPDITFPIYTIKTRELSLPISLSYLSGGIKVTDEASWTGLGWVLNAGGAINCSIQGLPDKLEPELPSADWIRQNNRYDILNKLVGPTNGGINGIDKMRDRYDYSFADKNGTFYIMGTDKVLQTPYTENIIHRLCSENKITTKGFIIINTEGTTYHFNMVETANVSSSVFMNESGYAKTLTDPYTYNCSWYLTKIVSFNKSDSIEFVYERDNNNYSDYVLSHSYSVTQYTGSNSPLKPDRAYKSFVNAKRTNNTPVLKEIKFAGGKVLFNRVNDRKDCRKYRLTRIDIQNEMGRILKTIEFNHSYFAGGRLKLNEVIHKGRDGEIFDKYGFSYYYENTEIPAERAEITSGVRPMGSISPFYSQDMFGYYNGKQNGSLLGLLPTDDPNYNRMIADRKFSLPHAMTHSLQKVKYITGGETEFIYDSDKIAVKVPALRIKEIKTIDPTKEVRSISRKIYNYYNVKSSSDFDNSNFIDCSYSIERLNSEGISFTPMRKQEVITYYSEPLIPSFSLSCKLKYGMVEELLTGENSAFSGIKDTIKTIYEYDDEDTKMETTFPFLRRFADAEDAAERCSCIQSILPPSSQIAISMNDLDKLASTQYNFTKYYIDNNWTNSFLKKVSTYKYQSGKYILIRSKENEYQYFERNDKVPIGLYCKGLQYSYSNSDTYEGNSKLSDYLYQRCPSIDNFYFFNIFISTGWKKLISTVTKDYNEGNITTKKDTYQYRGFTKKKKTHPFITEHYEDMGESGRNIYTYQYPCDADSLVAEVKEKMLSGNYIAPIILKQKVSFIQNLSMTETELHTYKLVNQDVLLQSISKTFSDDMNETGSLKGTYKTTALTFDSKGNPLWLINQAGFSTVYLWSYNYTYPVAEIKNATLEEVKTHLDVNIEILGKSPGSLFKLDRLRAKMPDALIHTYTYDPLIGRLTETAPNGVTTYYRYDTCGRLKELYLKNGNTERILQSYKYHYKND